RDQAAKQSSGARSGPGNPINPAITPGGAVRGLRTAAVAATAAPVLLASGLLAAGCGSSATTGATSGPVTITIWHNYGTEQNATALANLAKTFHKLHPNITVKVVSQDASNYFAGLQAAAISKNGP